MLKFCRFILIILIAENVSCAFYSNYTIDVNKYYSMPELNEFDDYNECMSLYQKRAKYCYVKSVIKPDSESSVYKNIEHFSSRKKQHFRHDRLTRGICINECMKIIETLDMESADDYYQPYFEEIGSKLTFDFINFSNYAEDRQKFNRIVNQCINYKLSHSFNISAFSSIEYCRGESSMYEVDNLDITFACLLTFLLATVYFSSSYDEYLRASYKKSTGVIIDPIQHYKQSPSKIAHRFLLAFSIKRNWYVLSAPIKDDARDTRAISGMRFWSLTGIVYGHVSWFLVEVPIKNPLWIEKNYHLMRSMVVINGANFVQNFFFISGFLNSLNLSSHINKDSSKKFGVFLRCVIYRYFRFVPMLLFLAMLNATWLHKFDDGPYWDKITIYERQSCRENLWTNLLFINNYVSGDLRCMIHTWYLSADFQLSAIGTALLLIAASFPGKRKHILLGSVALSFIISFVHFYGYNLEPVLMIPPETLRNQLVGKDEYDGYFYSFHSPTHLNTGNYLIGLVIGFFYYQYKQNNPALKHKRSIFNHILWYFSFAMIYVLCFIGIYFYEYDIQLGLISAFLGAVFKHIYGPIFGFVLVGLFLGYGSILPKIMNNGMYRVLGKLTFAVYMVHPVISNSIIMKNKHPIEVNNSTLIAFTLTICVISFFAALFLSLCIEIPIQVIYNTITNEVFGKQRQINNVEKPRKTNLELENESKTTKV